MNETSVRYREEASVTKLAALLALAGIDKTKLHRDFEVVEVEVERHPKTAELSLAPSYLDADPHASGFKSMRFFRAINPEKIKSVGQKFHARVLKVYPTKRANRQGHLIVNLTVEIV